MFLTFLIFFSGQLRRKYRVYVSKQRSCLLLRSAASSTSIDALHNTVQFVRQLEEQKKTQNTNQQESSSASLSPPFIHPSSLTVPTLLSLRRLSSTSTLHEWGTRGMGTKDWARKNGHGRMGNRAQKE